MNLEFLNTATAKELEQFKAVCNQLLSRTYVVRTLYPVSYTHLVCVAVQ